MERLTFRGTDGHFESCEPINCVDEYSNIARNIVVNQLGAYEATNLTPSDIADLRNELCLKCGRYKTAHEGSCDGCRWKLTSKDEALGGAK